VLRYIIDPVIGKHGYAPAVRADHITQQGTINVQVFQHLWNDELVIADLTGDKQNVFNPNVFYELAIRHLSKRPFVQIISKPQT
jgi:hypothetical protein